MSFRPEIVVCDSAEELSRVACEKVVAIIAAAGCGGWPLSIALSGGSTPRRLYTRLREEHMGLLKEDRALRFFFGDERLVAADDAASNYNMAREALLRDVPDDLVVPVDTDGVGGATAADAQSDAERRAESYERQIAGLLPLQNVGASSVRVPVFDIVLLGLGADGHTASIFPGSRAECETRRAVSVGFPSPAMSPKVWRVTLTPVTIMQARHVIVLATGGEKKWVLDNILADTPTETPVSRFLRDCKGEVVFIVDREIAGGSTLGQ